MFHTLARPPVRDVRLFRQESKRAFTLIELLAVVAIIGLLSAITFGIVKGVNQRAAVGQAKAELSVLAQALEEYKRQYGDYPQTGSSPVAPTGTATATSVQGELFNALMGKLGPTLVAIDGKQFIEPSKFSLQDTTTAGLPTTGNTTAVANGFLDPWGRLYMYYYRPTGTAWTKNSSYVLLSAGPDGKEAVTFSSTGVMTETAATTTATAADNIYANKN